jgi:hypothetical protein
MHQPAKPLLTSNNFYEITPSRGLSSRLAASPNRAQNLAN